MTSVFLHIHKYTLVKHWPFFSNLFVIGNINPISGDKQNTFEKIYTIYNMNFVLKALKLMALENKSTKIKAV